MDIFWSCCISEENLKKIKPLTKEQILISLDRLTRFKEPEIKYLRVFGDIITGNLIEPKYKKSDLEEMDFSLIRDLAQEIFNYSLKNLGLNLKDDYSINEQLLDYEHSIFEFSENCENLMKNKINYASALDLIPDDAVFNLRWLKSLAKGRWGVETRGANMYPVEKILLVEGITEEILLPKFAKLLDYDFKKNGIFVISAGGKNQVVKYFYRFAQCLKIPIFVLLDSDAQENYEQIMPRLRKNDFVHVISKGEFEDILPKTLVKKTVNYEMENISTGDFEKLDNGSSTVEFLEEFFRNRGLHEFKKAEFASFVSKNLNSLDDISDEIKEIIIQLKRVS